MERNFSPTDISETDLRDTKLDQLFVWDFRGIFENLIEKSIELSYRKILESNDSKYTNNWIRTPSYLQ